MDTLVRTLRILSRRFSFGGLSLVALGLLPTSLLAADWSGQMKSDGGITHVFNPSTPSTIPQTIELEELWRIGGDTDDDDEFFGVITRVVTDAEGNVYLLDMQLNEVSVFDPEGGFITRMGREGEGPGEFRRPGDLFLTPDGKIAVLQSAPGKIVLYNKDGSPAGEHPLPLNEDGSTLFLTAGRSSGDGLVLLVRQGQRRDNGFTSIESLVRIDRDGKEVARFAERTTERNFANMTFKEVDTGFGRNWDVTAESQVILNTTFDAYRFEIHGANGDLERIVEREYSPRERTADEMETIKSRFGFRMGRRGRARQIEVEASPTDRDIQRIYPRDDGSLWVLSSHGAFDTGPGTLGTFDVFDSEGRFIRQVTLEGEGDFQEDGFYFAGDRLFVVTDLQASIRAMRGQDGEDGATAEEEEEPEPISILCYHL